MVLPNFHIVTQEVSDRYFIKYGDDVTNFERGTEGDGDIEWGKYNPKFKSSLGRP
jgi:hypothetical protein